MNPLCEGQFNKDRVGLTLTGQEEGENFLKSYPASRVSLILLENIGIFLFCPNPSNLGLNC